MNNWVKAGIGLIVAGGIGTLIYFGIKKKTEVKEEPPKQPDEPSVPPSGGGGGYQPNESFPLKRGMNGPNVKKLQTAIINLFNDGSVGPADGSFGSKTQRGVEIIGYSVPLSKADFEAILSGKQKTSSPKPVSGFKNGQAVYTKKDKIYLFSKPIMDVSYAIGTIPPYTRVGDYIEDSSVKGWSKVYVLGYTNMAGNLVDQRLGVYVITSFLTATKP